MRFSRRQAETFGSIIRPMLMNKLAVLEPHVPFLRRYARSLSGRQEVGDYAVALFLDDLTEQRTTPPSEAQLRSFLHRGVAEKLARLGVIALPDLEVDKGAVTLPLVTSLDRHTCLLTRVEGFDDQEAALVVKLEDGRIRGLIEDGDRELSSPKPVCALTIDNERFAALRWEAELRWLGHSVAGYARTEADAYALAGQHKPGLIVAGTSIEGRWAHGMLNEIAERCHASLVIVSSAPRASLTATRREAAFVLAKQAPGHAFAAMIGQALLIKERELADYKLPERAEELLSFFQGETSVIVSTIATRQFAYVNGGADVCHYFRWSFLHFLKHFGFREDVEIVSIPRGPVSYRSHAKVTLRKEPWISSSSLSEIVSVIYRELRDPKPGISLLISYNRSWWKD
jgi:hypothetical protein